MNVLHLCQAADEIIWEIIIHSLDLFMYFNIPTNSKSHEIGIPKLF